MKQHFIEDLNTGSSYTSDFAVIKKQTRTAKNGKPYLTLNIADKTGKMQARMWEEIPNELKWVDIQEGKVYELEGRIDEFQNNKQFIISHLKAVVDYKREDFIATIKEDRDEMWKNLQAIHKQVKNKWMKQLLNSFFEDDEFVKEFKEAPAAKVVHDSFLGGLMRHTFRMTKLALHIIDEYPEMDIDKDMVICGIAFHDMEKINEYSYDGVVIEHSDTGRFIGHTVMACNSLYAKIKEIKDFPQNLADHIIHIVAAHAGEYDPIRLPATQEATLVHLVDFLDSRLVHLQQEKDSIGPNTGWKKDYYTGNWMFFDNKNDSQKDVECDTKADLGNLF